MIITSAHVRYPGNGLSSAVYCDVKCQLRGGPSPQTFGGIGCLNRHNMSVALNHPIDLMSISGRPKKADSSSFFSFYVKVCGFTQANLYEFNTS